MSDLFSPLELPRGPAIKNRFVLAPMTTTQSHEDGIMSDVEHEWLSRLARSGFGMITTCASHVQANGKGFPGQMGCFSDDHLPGLTKLANSIREGGAVSSVQLHHAGNRAWSTVEDMVSPSDDAETGARALTPLEIENLIEDFIAAALRVQKAGFDGVQVHGAHGYILTQFLSPTINKRNDQWGGSFENRIRLLLTIVNEIRSACRPDFQVGVRLSPERFGVQLDEMIELSRILLAEKQIDYLDLSLWDILKEPEDERFKGKSLASCFLELERADIKVGIAGKIMTGPMALKCLEMGADYAAIGKAAIATHDFPDRIRQDPQFGGPDLPVKPEHLAKEGLGQVFIAYLEDVFPKLVAR